MNGSGQILLIQSVLVILILTNNSNTDSTMYSWRPGLSHHTKSQSKMNLAMKSSTMQSPWSVYNWNMLLVF